MLKLVVLFAFVAACSASYNVGLSGVLGLSDSYFVDVADKYIKIANQQGDVVTFTVDNVYSYSGPQSIYVQFYGQGVGRKSVQVGGQQSIYSQVPQSDILYQIFNNYEGPLDEIQYQKLISVIASYVEKGQISHVILYVLQALTGQYEVLSYLDQYQSQYKTPYYQGVWSPWTAGYGVNAYSKTQYNKHGDYYGPYNTVYNFLNTKYGIQYPQNYYGGLGYQSGSNAYGDYYGPYNTVYKFLNEKYGIQYPQNYYGGVRYQSGSNAYGDYYGPYNTVYQFLNTKYGIQYPQNYEGYGYQYGNEASYGQYPWYGYQYGKGIYGSYYPQQYQELSRSYYPYGAKWFQSGSSYPSQLYSGYYGPYAGEYQFASGY